MVHTLQLVDLFLKTLLSKDSLSLLFYPLAISIFLIEVNSLAICLSFVL